HGRNANASVLGRADRAEIGGRSRSNYVAVDIQHLDVESAAAGQQGGAKHLEIDLKIERAGVLGDDAIIILVSGRAGKFPRRREDGRVLHLKRGTRAEKVGVGHGARKWRIEIVVIDLVNIRAQLQYIRNSAGRGDIRRNNLNVLEIDVGIGNCRGVNAHRA